MIKKYFAVFVFVSLFSSMFFSALRAQEAEKVVVFETTQGSFEVKLMPDIAPKACENLLTLIERHYYDGIVFHRVIDGFMIQGGDPTATGMAGESAWGKPFEDEFSAGVQFDKSGILAMANSGPNSNNSQFFITLAPTPHLNNRHTIFGQVISGYEVVKAIGQTPVDSRDRPLTDQKIIRAYLK